MSLQTPYLDIHNARVFQGQTQVFDGLSLQFFKGEHSCILGPNGAGKTTLLKLLTRELYPVVRPRSFVKIYGSETAILWELRQKIGFVSQDLQNRYDAHVKGRDVVLSGLFGSIGMHGHFNVTEEQQLLVDSTLEQHRLSHLQDRRFWHLSTGQQRRFLLARATIHKPEILILDEPTNGLDLKAAHALLAELRDLCQQGTTLLLVTHHIHEIIPEIARVVILKDGSVAHDGSKDSTLTDDLLSQAFDTPLHVQQFHNFYQAFPV